jgi:hypothetical protein
MEGQADLAEDNDTISGLTKKYPWWTPKTAGEEKD